MDLEKNKESKTVQMNTKEKIQKYIERNNIAGGLKYLLGILKGKDDQLYDDILIVQSNYKRAVRNFNNRILDMSDLQKEEAKTASALLDYADDIMDLGFDSDSGSGEHARNPARTPRRILHRNPTALRS